MAVLSKELIFLPREGKDDAKSVFLCCYPQFYCALQKVSVVQSLQDESITRSKCVRGQRGAKGEGPIFTRKKNRMSVSHDKVKVVIKSKM